MTVSEICADLQSLQRQRAVVMKSRIMQANRLQAVIAGTLGYRADMTEADRRRKFAEARAVIAATAPDPVPGEHRYSKIIRATRIGTAAFDRQEADYERDMARLADRLPVAAWAKTVRGFGVTSRLFLAIVVGECGDLSNYANPGKVWRRMGCAPWTFDGKTQMGATWRGGKKKDGDKLPKDQWTAFGYSPRRRSIAYLIGEGLMKQNLLAEGKGDERRVVWKGPYRERYEAGRAAFAAKHPDYKPKRCQLHGMLLATKLLLRDLWVEWHGHPPKPDYVTRQEAGAA